MGNCCSKDNDDANFTHKKRAEADPADLKKARKAQIEAKKGRAQAKKVGHAQVEHANACDNVWILAAEKFNAQNNQHLGKNFYGHHERLGKFIRHAQGN